MATKPRLTGIIDRATIAALRALDIHYQDNDKVYVVGVGLFDFDLSSNATDNGSTVIKPDTIAPGDPGRWLKAAGGASEIVTTSITPVVFVGGSYPSALATPNHFASLVRLSTGDRIEHGRVTWTGHGLTPGRQYYLSQSTAGAITPTKPTSGVVQRILYVEDENTLHVDVEPPEIASGSTTSLTPVVHTAGGFVGAQATANNSADLIQLSDGTRLHDGKVTWTAHGLTVGNWYYTSQTTAGAYVTPAPTSGLVQRLFLVEDANTIHVAMLEADDPVAAGSNIISEIINDTGSGGEVVMDDLRFGLPPVGQQQCLTIASVSGTKSIAYRTVGHWVNYQITNRGGVIDVGTTPVFFDGDFGFYTNADYQQVTVVNKTTGKMYRVTALYVVVETFPKQIYVTIERLKD